MTVRTIGGDETETENNAWPFAIADYLGDKLHIYAPVQNILTKFTLNKVDH